MFTGSELDREYLEEYTYTGISGTTYTPYVLNGAWYVVGHNPVSFWDVVYMCNIPVDHALLLRLKYTTTSLE